MLDKSEELDLEVSHLIPLKGLLQSFSSVSSTLMKLSSRFVFTLLGLFVFMIYWIEVYSELCRTSKIEHLRN